MSRIYFFIFLLIAPVALHASLSFSPTCKKAYSEIFKLNYEEAEYLIKIEELYNPSNPSILFLRSGILLMKSILVGDPEAIESFHNKHEELVGALNKNNDSKIIKEWLLTETNFHSALVHLKTGNYLQGSWKLRKAYKLAIQSGEKDLKFLKVAGLTEAVLSTVPDDYQWLLQVFGMNGNFNSGIKKLYRLYSKTLNDQELNFLFSENVFYIVYLEGNINNNIQSVLKLLNKKDKEVSDPLNIYLRFSLFKKSGAVNEATKLLSEINTGHPNYFTRFPYLAYMTGLQKLEKLDVSASVHFYQYMDFYKGDEFIKASLQKLAWIALLQNNVREYNKLMLLIKRKGKVSTDQDKQAHGESVNNELPHIDLLKSRLLFDGGNYDVAENILYTMNIQQLNEKNLIEYFYRFGRVKQGQGDYDTAEKYFKKAIMLQKELDFYFAPNAALQIALIAEEKKDLNKAVEYYRKAYSYKNHNYKNSVQQKAKAGLKRIKN